MSPRILRSPPRIKILEAAGAIGDGRVKLSERDGKFVAEVVSSDASKTYRVVIAGQPPEIRAYSTDNGTKLRGYIGYPIIATLMLAGILPRNRALEEALKGIPWKKLNERYKKYSIVMEIALNQAEKQGVQRGEAEAFIDKTMSILRSLRVRYDPALLGLEEYF